MGREPEVKQPTSLDQLIRASETVVVVAATGAAAAAVVLLLLSCPVLAVSSASIAVVGKKSPMVVVR